MASVFLVVLCLELPAATILPGQEGFVVNLRLLEKQVAENEADVQKAIEQCQNGNYQDAVPVLKRFAARGNVSARYVLALLQAQELGVEKNVPEALSLLEANMAEAHGPSMFVIGQIKEIEKKPEEALFFYQRAAGAGLAHSHLKLGEVFEQGGLGMKKNPKLAFSHYQNAAEGGSAEGCLNLGRCYQSGYGVSADALTATRWTRKAAMGGNSNAIVAMARRYFEGIGMEADPVAALGWLTLGSRYGSSEAMVLLGRRNEIGDLLPQDFNRAGQLYANAAKLGDPAGQYYLGLMYRDGLGVSVDKIRAYVLFEGVQVLPAAKEDFEKLARTLSSSDLQLAKEKIAEAKLAK